MATARSRRCYLVCGMTLKREGGGREKERGKWGCEIQIDGIGLGIGKGKRGLELKCISSGRGGGRGGLVHVVTEVWPVRCGLCSEHCRATICCDFTEGSSV